MNVIEEIMSKSGLPTLKVNDYLLHSLYDPKKEAENFFEKNKSENTIYVLFGNGLGYLAELFRKTKQPVYVMEPIVELKEKYYQSGVTYTTSPNDIIYEIFKNRFTVEPIRLICSPNYNNLFPEKYQELSEGIVKSLNTMAINENSVNAFSLEWQKNVIYNMEYLVKDDSVANLIGKYNKPIILASGGPSLTKQIPLLKKYREKIVIISSGSTITSLLAENIKPDYVVSIDGGELNYKHYKDIETDEIKLIYSPMNNYKIRELFSNNAYYFLTNNVDSLNGYLSKLTGQSQVIVKAAYTVATYALILAANMTNNKVAMIGQDLAYTNQQSHASGNKALKTLSEEQIEKGNYFYVEGYNGDSVLTDAIFYTMIEAFRSIAKEYSIVNNIYNCTEGGAHIEGFENMPFEQFLKTYSNENIEESVNLKQKNKVIELSDVVEKELRLYKELLKKLKNIKLDFEKVDNLSPKLIKKLNEFDKKLSNASNEMTISAIMHPLTLDLYRKFENSEEFKALSKEKKIFEKQKRFYSKLYDALTLCHVLTEEFYNYYKKKGQ